MTKVSQEVRFSGPPDRLQALLPRALPRRGVRPLLRLPEIGEVRLQFEPAGPSTTWLRCELPGVAPGAPLSGLVDLSGEMLPASVVVEALVRGAFNPPLLALSVPCGGMVEKEVEVANVGNVPFEVPEKVALGLFERGGVERSFGRAWRSEKDQGVDRLGRLADEMAASHGGMALLRVQHGAGTLYPGEVRSLGLQLETRASLDAGRTWTSMWTLAGVTLSFEITSFEDTTAAETVAHAPAEGGSP